MYDLIKRCALAILKAPPEPRPPFGDPGSLRVFNAGRNYLRLKLLGWTLAQTAALGGIIFWTAFLFDLDRTVREVRQSGKSVKMKMERARNYDDVKMVIAAFFLKLPAGAFVLIWGVKILSILFYLAQLPFTYAVRRLDYEMRWYMVTDRSLRLRHGVWKITESTMSFANIQQVVVSQGPLQRLLGLGDVKVKSAGGGDEGAHSHHHGADMHTSLFHCVTNAEEIRDLILERLRRFRESGLGDPDDKPELETPQLDSLTAAQEVLAEARALRAAATLLR